MKSQQKQDLRKAIKTVQEDRPRHLPSEGVGREKQSKNEGSTRTATTTDEDRRKPAPARRHGRKPHLAGLGGVSRGGRRPGVALAGPIEQRRRGPEQRGERHGKDHPPNCAPCALSFPPPSPQSPRRPLRWEGEENETGEEGSSTVEKPERPLPLLKILLRLLGGHGSWAGGGVYGTATGIRRGFYSLSFSL